MRKSYDFSTARRGPIRPLRVGKSRITIRLDDDVLQWFKVEDRSRRPCGACCAKNLQREQKIAGDGGR